MSSWLSQQKKALAWLEMACVHWTEPMSATEVSLLLRSNAGVMMGERAASAVCDVLVYKRKLVKVPAGYVKRVHEVSL